MQKRIYIETTIPSSYYTLRTDEESLIRQKLTRQWWDEYANLFTLTSSTAVIDELEAGSTEVTLDRLAYLMVLRYLILQLRSYISHKFIWKN